MPTGRWRRRLRKSSSPCCPRSCAPLTPPCCERRTGTCADKLAAYIKCLEELEAGNNEFGDAAGETLESLRGMEMEEVSWFLDHFAEAFGLTLDGLQKGSPDVSAAT